MITSQHFTRDVVVASGLSNMSDAPLSEFERVAVYGVDAAVLFLTMCLCVWLCGCRKAGVVTRLPSGGQMGGNCDFTPPLCPISPHD